MKLVLASLAWQLYCGAAQAQTQFDPEVATRAWMATIGPEATARSNSYFEGGYWIQLANAVISIGLCMLILQLGWAQRVRTWLERIVKFKFLVAMGMAMFVVATLTVLSFPFDYWVGFVREHAFGLSTQKFGAWFGETMLNDAISIVVASIFVALLYLLVRIAKEAWWAWASGLTAMFFALAIAVAPVFIAPLFNTYKPMEEGAQKTDILQMAQANGVPADNVYVFDESRQSNRVTANVSGLMGTTRVSLADNLLKRVSPESVRSVVGHELGHYVLGHIWSLIFMLSVLMGVLYACVHFSFKALSKGEKWGVRGLTDPAGMPLAFALFIFFSTLATPLNNNIIRFHEHQADIFGINASRAPDGFAEAAVLLSEYRKMAPTPLEEWFFYDHPSGYERIHMAMVWKAHEIEAGHLPDGPSGPPRGWKPDFVVAKEKAK